MSDSCGAIEKKCRGDRIFAENVLVTSWILMAPFVVFVLLLHIVRLRFDSYRRLYKGVMNGMLPFPVLRCGQFLGGLSVDSKSYNKFSWIRISLCPYHQIEPMCR